MSLQSIGFFGFLLIVAAVYLHLPQRWQNPFLLAASWYFYAKAMPAMLPVTIAIAACTYACGRAMQRHKTAALRVGVIGLLVILAFFKYNGAFAADGGWQAVAMPLGISFYSFAAISYLIDAARGDCEVETNFIDCVLYLNFFATITQGPICRAGDLLPQLKQEHRFDAARTVRGLRLLALGLAHIQVLCRAYYPQFAATCPGGHMPKIAVRDMTTRWGSCSLKTGTLAFARRLCVAPLPAQEYVVVHEFCHFAHPNHGPGFWAAVAAVMPDYKARERLLKQM